MTEPQTVKPFASVTKIHDPRLVRVDLQVQSSQRGLEEIECLLGVLPRVTQDDKVIGVSHHLPKPPTHRLKYVF